MPDRVQQNERSFEQSDVNPKWNLVDVFSKLRQEAVLDPPRATDSPKRSDSPTQTLDVIAPDDLERMATRATDLITKDGDFNHYGKREELKEMFADAANKGKNSVEQLTNAINDELSKRNSHYRIKGGYQEESKTVDEAVYPTDGRLLYVTPRLVKYTYAGASVTLTNTNTNRTEDALNVRGNELRREDVRSLEFPFPIEHRR